MPLGRSYWLSIRRNRQWVPAFLNKFPGAYVVLLHVRLPTQLPTAVLVVSVFVARQIQRSPRVRTAWNKAVLIAGESFRSSRSVGRPVSSPRL